MWQAAGLPFRSLLIVLIDTALAGARPVNLPGVSVENDVVVIEQPC
jgi:hypothetical protein